MPRPHDFRPASSNVYDSLGEAYMDHGDNDLAIKNYQKSLQLNARNTNAVVPSFARSQTSVQKGFLTGTESNLG